MNTKSMKFAVAGIFIFIAIIAIWQFFYISDAEKRADPAYIAQEQEAERQKEIERQQIIAAAKKNPRISDDEKLDEEKRRELEREMFKTKEDMINIKEVNDYMKAITEAELDRDMSSIENNLSNGNVESAVKTANILTETYDLNDYPNEIKLLDDVKRVYKVSQNDSAMVHVGGISDARMYIYSFIFASRDIQTRLVLDKGSEVINYSGDKIDIGEPEEFSIIESGILSITNSTKGYSCYRVSVDIGNSEYYCYILYRKISHNWEILKFLDKEASSKGIGKNTYEAYVSYNVAEDEKQTYGIKWRGY